MTLRAVTVAAAILVAFSGLGAAAPAGFPGRPISMIVPAAPGGGTDIVGRGIAEAVKKHLPVPVVVVNRPGGAGTIAISEVVMARPDGYTIGLGAVAMVAVQPHLTPLPYRTPADYTPILKLVNLPVTLFVRSDAPWKTAADLLEYARANPGKIRVGIPGTGTILHLNVEELRLLSRADLPVVPFGSPHQVTALLGGHVEAAVAHPSLIVGHVEAGKIRVLGVFQAKRNALFPEAHTFKELGYDITRGVYYFLMAPKDISRSIVMILHDAFRQALAEPSFVTLAKRNGFDIDYLGPGTLTRELWASFEQYGRLVNYLGLKQ